MGKQFIDQFSILHLAVGIVVYFWGMSLKTWIILHTIFEIIENTPRGMKFITYNFDSWPGGKLIPDSLLNCVGDTIFAILGWFIAKYLDDYYTGGKTEPERGY